MKLIVFVTLMASIVLSFNTSAQKYYRYYQGKKIEYTISDKKIIVQSERHADLNLLRKSLLENKTTESVTDIDEIEGLSIANLKNVTRERIEEYFGILNKDSNVEYVSPVLINDSGQEIGGFTNKIIIRLKKESDIKILEDLLKVHKAFIERKYEYDDKTYILKLKKAASRNSLELANFLHETGFFEYAEPNLLHFLDFGTTDPFFEEQWAVNNTGQSGGTLDADMDVLQVWEITSGNSNIAVAVLDIGVQLDHPDLNDNLLYGFDATGNGSAGAPTSNTGDVAHGTACAGIVAAEANNNLGTVGIAYDCNILPIRIATKSSGYTVTESQFMAAAVDWARLNGADVISMSFSAAELNLFTQAINNAVTQGRNNLGCLVLSITQNQGVNAITYPASIENVIAVGATDHNDQRASFSNYGTGIDIVAPGVNIYTTDRQGNIGYNTDSGTDGDYYDEFSGTSAACPNAAGVAALILSVNPTLTQSQARNILESNTDKIDGYTYSFNVSGQPNGSWNSQVGYGRVNAYKAVFEATGGSIAGPNLICTSNTTFSLNGYASGLTIDWDCNTSVLTPVGGDSGSSYVVKAKYSSTSGEGWVRVNIITDCGDTITRQRNVWVGKVDGDKIVSSREGQAVGAWAQYRLLCDEGTTEVVAGYDSNGDGEMIGDSYYLSYQSITGYEWNFPSGWSYYDTYEGIANEYIDVSPDGSTYPEPGQMVQVGIRAQNGCGWSNWKYDYWQVISCGGGWYMSVSPNPSNGMVTVSINNKSKTYNSRIEENITWVLDVYNINQPQLKERKTKIQSSNSTTINTSGWEKGIYIVQAQYGDKVLQAKLVVK